MAHPENEDTHSEPTSQQQAEKPGDQQPLMAENKAATPEPPEESPAPKDHPGPSAPKKARQYLVEFLMIFLAVFAGFLADNWRENIQENEREKEFIQSIIEDLKSDTLQSGRVLLQLKKTSKNIDSVLAELASPGIVENSNRAYDLWTKNLDIKVFVSNDRTIQQLKNNGELRLIRKKGVSDGIMKYDQAVKNYTQQSNFMYNALSDQQIYRRFFNFIRLEQDKTQAVPLTEAGKNSLNEAYAHLQLWNSALLGLISWLEDVNAEGKKLLALIQEEYQIKTPGDTVS